MGMFGSFQPWSNLNGLGNIIEQFSTPQNQQNASLLGVNMRPQFPLPQPEMQPDPSLAGPMAQLPNDPRIAQALKPKPFAQDGKGWKILGALGDALQTAGGGKATYLPFITEQRQRDQEQQNKVAQQALERLKFNFQIRKDSQPTLRELNGNLVSVPFDGGDPSVIYTAPTDAEQYAAALGIGRDDPRFADTINDFVLKGNGPTAFDQRKELRGVPQARVFAPQRPTASTAPRTPRSVGEAVAPILLKLRSGQPLTAGEQQALGFYNTRGRGGRVPMPSPQPAISPTGSQYHVGQTATNAQGKKVQFDGQRWVPLN